MKAKKNFKIVGVAIHSWNDFKFLKSLKLDFIKILGSSFGDYEYFDKVKSLNTKRIILSTGGRSLKQISDFVKKIKKRKITLLYTFFTTKNFEKDIKLISYMKKNSKLRLDTEIIMII